MLRLIAACNERTIAFPLPDDLKEITARSLPENGIYLRGRLNLKPIFSQVSLRGVKLVRNVAASVGKNQQDEQKKRLPPNGPCFRVAEGLIAFGPERRIQGEIRLAIGTGARWRSRRKRQDFEFVLQVIQDLVYDGSVLDHRNDFHLSMHVLLFRKLREPLSSTPIS